MSSFLAIRPSPLVRADTKFAAVTGVILQPRFKRIVADATDAARNAAHKASDAALSAAATRDEPDVAEHAFAERVKNECLPENLGPYDLRHACATLLLERGANPKMVADQLWHATIHLTADTYSHVTIGMLGQLSNEIDEALFGPDHVVITGAAKTGSCGDHTVISEPGV